MIEKVVAVPINSIFRNPISPAWQQIVMNEANKLRNLNRDFHIGPAAEECFSQLVSAIKQNDAKMIETAQIEQIADSISSASIKSLLGQIKDNIEKAKNLAV